MTNNQNFCVIMAGGIGRRLWPYSRKNLPKQFVDFFGTGRTLLQQTYDRYAKFIPAENIYISTFEDYIEVVKQQLPEVNEAQLLVEPVQLSTAPAAAWTALYLTHLFGGGNLIITPADQYIVDENRFVEQVSHGLEYVDTHNNFLAVGVRPTTPNTGYGYIQMDDVKDGGYPMVKSFTEKPDLQFAEMFVSSGEFLWNSGMFMCNLPTMLEMLARELPTFAPCIEKVMGGMTNEETRDLFYASYPSMEHQSIDLLLLEKTKNVVVMACNFGWADIGSWPELHEVERKDGDDNAVISSTRVLFDKAYGNLVCLPDAKAAVIAGLEGYLIAEKDGVLVICPNHDAAIVRRLVTEAQMKLGDEFV